MKYVLVASMLLAGSSAYGASRNPEQKKAPNALICRDITETGSRLGTTRICKSREEWEAARREAQDVVERGQSAQINPCGAASKC